MTEVTIIPFKAEHLEVMNMRDHEKSLCSDKATMRAIESSSICCTGIIDGRVICCGGVSPSLNGNGNIWLVPSVYLQDYTVVFVRSLRKWLFQVREDLALTRMETECMDDDLHNAWMKSLGFTKEGTKRKYYNGKDYNMWGRLWE